MRKWTVGDDEKPRRTSNTFLWKKKVSDDGRGETERTRLRSFVFFFFSTNSVGNFRLTFCELATKAQP